MKTLVYHPESEKLAKSLDTYTSFKTIPLDFFKKNEILENVVYLSRNGDNHHVDLENIKLIKEKRNLKKEDLSVTLYDFHTDTLVENPVFFNSSIEEVATYANWAGLGVNNLYNDLSIVGCGNGKFMDGRHHYGAEFIVNFPSDIVKNVRIFTIGPENETATKCPDAFYLEQNFLNELSKNPSVKDISMLDGLLKISWDTWKNFDPSISYGLNKIYPDLNKVPYTTSDNCFVSIDLDVLKKGEIDSDWEGRGEISVDDLKESINKNKKRFSKIDYSISGLRENWIPDKKSKKNLVNLIESME